MSGKFHRHRHIAVKTGSERCSRLSFVLDSEKCGQYMPWGPTVHIWVYSKISFDVKDISLYKPPFQEMYKYVLIRIVHNSMKSVILPPWHLLNEIQTEVSEVRRCSDLSLVQKMEQEVRGRSRCIIFCRCPPCIEWGEFKAGFWCGRSRKKFQCACQGPVSLEVFQCLQRRKMERARS